MLGIANVLDGMDRTTAAQAAGMDIFGAVCPSRDVGAALVMPYVNIEAMNLHLAEIAKEVLQGAHAVVIIDGAGWHLEGGALKVPDNLSLLRLPPYSPELNAQENIWQFLRQNFLAGRIFDADADTGAIMPFHP